MAGEYDYRDKYQSRERAERYDNRHFKSLKGRIFTSAEARQLGKIFKTYFPTDGCILDLPCGTGRIMEQLLAQGFQVQGGDISQAMLDVARAKLGRHQNLKGLQIIDGTSIPYPDGAFQGAVCMRFMCNIPHELQRKILGEIARVTNGPIAVGFSLQSPWMTFRGRLKRIVGGGTNDYPVADKTIAGWGRELNLAIRHRSLTLPWLSEQLVVVFERKRS